MKEADDLARSLYEIRDMAPGVVWWIPLTIMGRAVDIQTQWLNGPALKMYEGYGEMRKDLVQRELVEKLKMEFENAGDWKAPMKEGVEWMIKQMGEYARDKRRIL